MIPLEEIETPFGTIAISRNPATGVVVYAVGGCHQSSADSNGISLASYIHAMFGLLRQAKARNMLLIGGGGGTLGTLLSRAGHSASLVDVNPAAFDVAKRYFGMGDNLVCHVAEAEAFLRGDAGFYDAIVLDAFHGEEIPSHLQTPAFFALLRQRLTPNGAVLANLRVKHDFDDSPDRLAVSMKGVWADVRVLDAMGICDRNAIVMAGRVAQLRPPKLLVRPNINAELIADELGRMQFRPWKSSRWDFGR